MSFLQAALKVFQSQTGRMPQTGTELFRLAAQQGVPTAELAAHPAVQRMAPQLQQYAEGLAPGAEEVLYNALIKSVASELTRQAQPRASMLTPELQQLAARQGPTQQLTPRALRGDRDYRLDRGLNLDEEARAWWSGQDPRTRVQERHKEAAKRSSWHSKLEQERQPGQVQEVTPVERDVQFQANKPEVYEKTIIKDMTEAGEYISKPPMRPLDEAEEALDAGEYHRMALEGTLSPKDRQKLIAALSAEGAPSTPGPRTQELPEDTRYMEVTRNVREVPGGPTKQKTESFPIVPEGARARTISQDQSLPEVSAPTAPTAAPVSRKVMNNDPNRDLQYRNLDDILNSWAAGKFTTLDKAGNPVPKDPEKVATVLRERQILAQQASETPALMNQLTQRGAKILQPGERDPLTGQQVEYPTVLPPAYKNAQTKIREFQEADKPTPAQERSARRGEQTLEAREPANVIKRALEEMEKSPKGRLSEETNKAVNKAFRTVQEEKGRETALKWQKRYSERLKEIRQSKNLGEQAWASITRSR
jgi:hypothetical protein